MTWSGTSNCGISSSPSSSDTCSSSSDTCSDTCRSGDANHRPPGHHGGEAPPEGGEEEATLVASCARCCSTCHGEHPGLGLQPLEVKGMTRKGWSHHHHHPHHPHHPNNHHHPHHHHPHHHPPTCRPHLLRQNVHSSSSSSNTSTLTFVARELDEVANAFAEAPRNSAPVCGLAFGFGFGMACKWTKWQLCDICQQQHPVQTHQEFKCYSHQFARLAEHNCICSLKLVSQRQQWQISSLRGRSDRCTMGCLLNVGHHVFKPWQHGSCKMSIITQLFIPFEGY